MSIIDETHSYEKDPSLGLPLARKWRDCVGAPEGPRYTSRHQSHDSRPRRSFFSENFRHVRIRGKRRVFAHPHLFLIGEGVVDFPNTLKAASLSAEPAPPDISFVAAAFEVDLDDSQREAFIRREPEYKIDTTQFYSLDDENGSEALGEGVICLASTDADIKMIRKPDSVKSVWNWAPDSGLLPLSLYLRHCLLAVEKVGGSPLESFLEDTYLVDRQTTLAKYLKEHKEEVMNSLPPPYLKDRFSG